MKVLFISNLFPDAAEPNRGIYNARLVKHLARVCDVRVVSPRPTRGLPPFWRPKQFVARAEDEAYAPVFPAASYIPKISSRWNHRLMARSIRETVRGIRQEFRFDVVLAAWVYPDGCAISNLASELDFPFVVIAQGSDVHQYLQMPVRRRIITAALNRSRGVIARSQALARLLAEAGVSESKLHTIYNGVEFDLFHPADRAKARNELGLPLNESVLLFVGNFHAIKNPLLLVAAHAELNRLAPQRPCRLVMLGDGPLRGPTQRATERYETSERVSLLGRKSPAEVARHMQAADVLCVSSDNEGVPNVIYEALSCGVRVVATKVGGIPEILRHDFLGRLVQPQNPTALARAIAETLSSSVEVEKIAQYAQQFSWERTAAEHLRVLERAIGRRADQ